MNTIVRKGGNLPMKDSTTGQRWDVTVLMSATMTINSIQEKAAIAIKLHTAASQLDQ